MKICFLGDIHFGARSDSLFFLNNQIISLREVIKYLEKEDIKMIFQLGDVFDRRKYINFNTLEVAKREFFDVLQEKKIEMKILLGNHDTFHKNSSKINSPNLLLSEYCNIEIIDDFKEFKIDDCIIAMAAWLNTENFENIQNSIKKSKADVLCGHFELSSMTDNSSEMNDEERSMFRKFSTVFSGHYHTFSHNSNFYYIGNISQLTWNDYKETKCAIIFDTVSHEIKKVPIDNHVFKVIEYSDELDLVQFDYTEYSEMIVRVFVPSFESISRNKFDIFIERMSSVVYSVEVIDQLTDFWSNGLTTIESDSEKSFNDSLSLLKNHVDMVIQEKSFDRSRLLEDITELYEEALSSGVDE